MVTEEVEQDIILDMSFLEKKPVILDKEQKAALDYEGSCYIMGPPGTGKTEVFEAVAEKWTGTSAWLPFTRAARKELMARLPTKILEEGQTTVATINSFCQSIIKKWPGSYHEQLTNFLKMEGKPIYSLVGIDEAQDLRPIHWEVVKSVMNTDSRFFGGIDPYQTIFVFGDAMGKDILKEFKDRNYKEFLLHNDYRSSEEVVSLLNFVYPRDIVAKGPKTYSRTAVFTRTHDQLEATSELLSNYGIPHSIRDRGGKDHTVLGKSNLFLMVTHACKGLGFDTVYQFDWRSKLSWEEKNLLYVSIARASKNFFLVDGDLFSLCGSLLLDSNCNFITRTNMVEKLKEEEHD